MAEHTLEPTLPTPAPGPEPRPGTNDGPVLFLIDDDAPLRRSLQRAMERRGFRVFAAESLKDGFNLAHTLRPDYAVVDLRLEDGSGIELVRRLRELHPRARIVILTGYGNIATAVAAVKAGAVDYLAKPADADEVIAALLSTGAALPPPPENPMSADRVRWEHIQRVFEQCNRNVSETARRLNMHRRTLQRILNKRAPRE
jgi:two-component system response regulator RegA